MYVRDDIGLDQILSSDSGVQGDRFTPEGEIPMRKLSGTTNWCVELGCTAPEWDGRSLSHKPERQASAYDSCWIPMPRPAVRFDCQGWPPVSGRISRRCAPSDSFAGRRPWSARKSGREGRDHGSENVRVREFFQGSDLTIHGKGPAPQSCPRRQGLRVEQPTLSRRDRDR